MTAMSATLLSVPTPVPAAAPATDAPSLPPAGVTPPACPRPSSAVRW